MSSQNQAQNGTKEFYPVITGIGGRFPDSDDFEEFKTKLYAGVDMVTRDGRRFPPGLYGTPERSGKLKSLDKFDTEFFNLSPRQAHVADPMVRMLLEATYESMFDAGVNPWEMRGSRTGVYIGTSTSASESNEYWLYDTENIDGLSGAGCCRSVFANRISLFFDFKGPSFPIDATCCSALLCLDLAVSDIMSGRAEAAIVAGVNVCLKPQDTLMLYKLGLLGEDGACKAFDERANGYVRSEAVGVLFLQKSCDRIYRNYGMVLGTLSRNDGYRELGLLAPSGPDQIELLEDLYNGANVDPSKLTYVEAHGSGTQIGDTFELNAISTVLCANKTEPLLVGSVKTNCGHSEPAAGILSVVKILMSAQEHLIPANLASSFKKANPTITGLRDGKLKVVTENTKWNPGLVGVSAFGVGGNNAHAILDLNPKRKADLAAELKTRSLPTLIPFSGRTAQAVTKPLQTLSEKPLDLEQVALIHRFFETTVPKHPYRGYGIYSTAQNGQTSFEFDETEFIAEPTARPVWYVFSGMGSQWPNMGKDLLEFPIFNKSIKESASILKAKHASFDLIKLLKDGTESDFKNVLNSLVSIVAVQIGLTEMLKAVGLTPSGIIGHSVGELSCAYADGSLTQEQTLLAAHARGSVLLKAKTQGSMASVGLGWAEAKSRVPEGIHVACHNSVDNVTLSGETGKLEAFLTQLKREGIFVREVDSSGQAFHSPLVAGAAALLQKELADIIPNPKPRTAAWISTSIPESGWKSELSKTSSAAYHANNLSSPVLFQEALQKVPDNAIVLEVAPHAILQSILKRAFPANSKTTVVPLQNQAASNNNIFLLRALGKVYQGGLNLKIAKLYPEVPFPVSLETRMTFPLVEWDHSVSWCVPTFDPTKPLVRSPFHTGEAPKAPFYSAHGNDYSNGLNGTTQNGEASINSNHLVAAFKNLLVQVLEGFERPMTAQNQPIEYQNPVPAKKVEQSRHIRTPGSLLATVGRSLGIQKLDRLNGSLTLAELGMESMLTAELRNLISTNYGWNGTMTQLLSLTVDEIREMDNAGGQVVVQNGHGGTKGVVQNGNGHAHKVSLLEIVKSSLGLKNLDKVNQWSTLGELGMESMLAAELKETLAIEFGKEFPMPSLLTMSLNKLRQIEEEHVLAY